MTLDMAYHSDRGGITWKSDVETLIYDYPGKPYAVSGIDTAGVGLVIPEYPQEISYTSFESVNTISENDYLATFVYNSDNQRAKMEVKQGGNTILTRWYPSDSYIKETAGGVTKEYTFIGGDAYSAPEVAVKTNGGAPVYYYLLRDYLGSITHVVDATNNSVVAEYSYDVWGRLRNPATWENYTPGSEPAPVIAGRGYTGHEHLPWFSLINMNGRIYDPLTGQFLSPDNFVQSPDLTINFNRYSYCVNNPLIYTDPDGEIIFTILSAIFCPALLPVAIGTDIGWISGGIRGTKTPGMNFWDGAWRGGIAGAVGGALSMVGGAGMSFAANLALGTAEGAITGGLDAALWGDDVGKGILWGAVGGALVTTVTSENMSNLFKGEGFYTNKNVFNNMMERGMGKQEILDYFGFKAKYVPERAIDALGSVDGKAYYGSTHPVAGNIKIGDLAFSSYDNLKGTYTKELFTHIRVTSGKELALYPDWQSLGAWGKNVKYYPEEALGFRYAFYNMGLYPKSSINYLSLANSYWFQSYSKSLMRDKAWYYFIFKIPRRW